MTYHAESTGLVNQGPLSWLKGQYQTYRKHIDSDPEAPKHIRMVTMTFSRTKFEGAVKSRFSRVAELIE